MKVGFFAIGIGNGARPEFITEIATTAEKLGFSTLWAPEHVVLFDRHDSKYPYDKSGVFPLPPEYPWLDPFLALTYASAVTRRIRLATGICLVPQRNPLYLAKEVATLDQLSGGRVMLGAGIGWLAEEFSALGVPFERRARRTREYITLMRRVWSEDKTTFHGEFVNVDGARSYPKPVAGGRVPILFGGESEPALKRVAAYGNGWFGFNVTPEEALACRKRLDELLKSNGRDAREIEIIVSPYLKPCVPGDLKRYREAGVNEVALLAGIPDTVAEVRPKLEKIAREWVEPAAALG